MLNHITSLVLNHITPIIGIISYFLYPTNLRINPTLLYNLSIVHNILLIGFSAWTFYSMTTILYKYGIVFQSNYYFKDPFYNKVAYYFYLSKFYEYIDTFLLYLKDKKPIFLHKFHHIGAVICFYLAYYYKVDGIWVGITANSFVHVLMYSYYLCSLLKIKGINFIKKYITTIQLLQFTVPFYFVVYNYFPPVETVFNYSILILFASYVTTLIVLFSIFYYNNYIQSKKVEEIKEN